MSGTSGVLASRSQRYLRQRFACPRCRGDLEWQHDAARCPCGKTYPIHHGVLCVVEASGAQAEFFSHAWGSRKPVLSIDTRRRLQTFPEVLRGAILEVGAGDGRVARHFSHLDIISSDLVIEGIRDLGPRAVVCSIGRLPFKPNTFDLIIAFEILEHLSMSELPRALRELHRVLRPGAFLWVSVPAWPLSAMERILRAIRSRCWPTLTNLARWDFPHERRYESGVLERTLEPFGFELVGVHKWSKSASALSQYLLNPLLRRVRLPVVDLGALDKLLPFDKASNQVMLARKLSSVAEGAG